MDKCWPSCDIYEFQLSFSPSVPIFCMVICWQIFIVILGPERPEEMHLKIHTGKVGRTIMKLQNSEFISAPTVWPCSDATVWGVQHYVFFHAARGQSMPQTVASLHCAALERCKGFSLVFYLIAHNSSSGHLSISNARKPRSRWRKEFFALCCGRWELVFVFRDGTLMAFCLFYHIKWLFPPFYF